MTRRRHFRFLRRAALGLLFLPLAACISFDVDITVRPDGSGTLTQTTLMRSDLIEQMVGMMKSMGGDDVEVEAKGDLDLFSEEDARKEAAKLGEGVRYVSSEKITRDGMSGMKATYAFTDVTKLRVREDPKAPSMPGVQADEGADEERLAFQFEKGKPSVLTIVFPKGKIDLDAKKEEKAAEEAPTPTAEELEQARSILKGLHIGISVTVDGKLVSSSSKYVEGSRVTLLEMDFEKLLSDPKALERLQRSEAQSIEEAKRALADIPGFKIPLDERIRIEFR